MSLHELTATEAAEGIRRKEISPVDLVGALLRRIDGLEAQVRAWAHVDRDGALSEAGRCADEAARGTLRGPLHGVPVAVKDIYYTAGLPTEAGSRVYAGFIPTYDATTVARLKEAGAILLGKLQTTEFATFDPAPTRNPWNLGHTPGGSSAGSAAAVAARMVPATLGSQTAGSVLRPASYCGVVALKPTYGRISLRGIVPITWIHDHVGIMARGVEDLALLLQATAGHDPADPTSAREPVPDYRAALERRRPPGIGLLRDHFFEKADAEVASRTREAVDRLAQAGARVEEAKLPASFRAIHAVGATVNAVGAATFHADLHAEKADLYGPKIRGLIEVGSLVPGELFLRALRIRRQFRRETVAALPGFDVLATPTTMTPAPAGLDSTGNPAFQVPWSAAGLPTITLPIGLSASGLPLGLQLIAGPFAEEALLSAAIWCEDVLGRLPPPPLPG
jgi:aspartyl-tRNA(Asn)/glutamyl-tRNA(Gln) amidotransferase subunit A